MKMKNGDIFEAEYKNEENNGHGILKYKNGDIYEGGWKEDKANGYGLLDKIMETYLKVSLKMVKEMDLQKLF